MPRKPININNQIDESKYINLKNSFLSNFSKCAHSPYSEKITGWYQVSKSSSQRMNHKTIIKMHRAAVTAVIPNLPSAENCGDSH